MLYFSIIFISMILCEILTVSVSLVSSPYSLTYAIIAPFFVNFYLIFVFAILSVVLRFAFPKRLRNYQNRYFKTRDNEMKKLQRLKIKKWKDKVPECGCAGGFPKNKLRGVDQAYLAKFLEETCFAEILHNLSALLGFTVLLFFPVQYYYFVLPLLFVNVFLHTLPCLIQRHTRYRLAKVYEFKLSQEDEEWTELQNEKFV